MRALRQLLPVLTLVVAAGCSEYHYYDLDVSMNTTGGAGSFSIVAGDITRIQVLIASVSGADSFSQRLGPNANGLPLSAGGHLGIIEVSTFADSGTLNFKVEAYASNVTIPECKVGEGTKAIMATSAATTMDALVVNKMGDFALCP